MILARMPPQFLSHRRHRRNRPVLRDNIRPNPDTTVSMPTRLFPPDWRGYVWLATALLILQAPLWLNPGYFSHDELQWATWAAAPSIGKLKFIAFGDFSSFQYRPLTFNLWLLLSHALFETPRLFHALFVLLGTLNALLLARILQAAGSSTRLALATALVFGLSPFAVWVHGWVGCLADLIWVGAALLATLAIQRLQMRASSVLPIMLVAALATMIGLLAKEAALSLPGLFACAALQRHGRKAWLAATLASAGVVLLYLGLRLDVLLHSPASSPGYVVDLAAIPRRWLEYQVYPWALGIPEVNVLGLASATRWAILLLILASLVGFLGRASPNLLLAWLGAGTLALGPVLVLPASSNQYGYGFMAVTCGVMALAFPHLGRYGRALVVFLVLLTLVHGAQIQVEMFRAGHLQKVFSPALVEVAKTQPDGPIRLWPQRDIHVYQRLSHDLPSSAGVRLGLRIEVVAQPDQATHEVLTDGQIRPLRRSPP